MIVGLLPLIIPRPKILQKRVQDQFFLDTHIALAHGGGAASLAAAEMWNLICDDGEFDISFHLSKFTAGYARLAAGAHRVRVGDVAVGSPTSTI